MYNVYTKNISPPHQINLQVNAKDIPNFRNFAPDLGQSALNENIKDEKNR